MFARAGCSWATVARDSVSRELAFVLQGCQKSLDSPCPALTHRFQIALHQLIDGAEIQVTNVVQRFVDGCQQLAKLTGTRQILSMFGRPRNMPTLSAGCIRARQDARAGDALAFEPGAQAALDRRLKHLSPGFTGRQRRDVVAYFKFHDDVARRGFLVFAPGKTRCVMTLPPFTPRSSTAEPTASLIKSPSNVGLK